MSTLWAQLRSIVFLSEEEMGKKDDDHQKDGAAIALRNPPWQPVNKVPPRRLVKRLVTLVAIAAAVWFTLSFLSPGLGFDDHRRSRYRYDANADDYGGSFRNDAEHKSAGGSGGSGGSAPSDSERIFDGPIKFQALAPSLHAIAGTRGGLLHNRNVLFVAASLKSASALLPIACDMGMELRNYVHFAFAGRDSVPIEHIRKINGIDDACEVIFHDARPDFGAVSTDTRMKHATARGLYHINNYMHPQAILSDGSEREESWFRTGARAQADFMGVPLIELPEKSKPLSWLTKLDSSALAAWDKITIDILVHAPPSGSGSLIRLLQSLSRVDFTASAVPHLTIEMPQKVEPETQNFLRRFRWPPVALQKPGMPQLMTLRHRVPQRRMTPVESAVRFVEAFWPITPKYSHVLVLSPQAELTPQFFHYVKFSLLDALYSTKAMMQSWDERLMSISMAVPLTYLNGTTAFVEPEHDSKDEGSEQSKTTKTKTSFLWQAPSSDIVLFTGHKWVEVHGFLSHTLERQEQSAGSGSTTPDLLSDKVVSKQYPSWLEYMLQLSRARGYLTLYPSSATAGVVAKVHTDLFQPPEEYAKDILEEKKEGVVTEQREKDSSAGPLVSILDTLPKQDGLVPLSDVPLLDWEGNKVALGELDSSAEAYAMRWRREVGGCEEEEQRRQPGPGDASAADLFCNKGRHNDG